VLVHLADEAGVILLPALETAALEGFLDARQIAALVATAGG
jgi:hypothetical protein